MSGWQPLGAVAPGDLVDARVELHFAVQHVAAVGASLGAPKPDGSHKGFTYDRATHAMVGVRIDGATPFRAALELPTLTLQLRHEGEGVIDELPLLGRTDEDAHRWLEHHADLLVGEDRTIARHRYDHDFPSHPVGDGAAYSIDDEDSRLVEIDRYFTDMALVLELVVSAESQASPATVWPHHLDLASLITVGETGDGNAKTVGVGLSPGDAGTPEPYVYVTPYPPPDASALPADDGPGTWQVEPWFGAALTGSAILAAGGDQQDVVTSFAERAISTSKTLLTT